MLRNRYRFLSFLLLTLFCLSCASVPSPTFSKGDEFQDTLSNGTRGPVMIVVPAGEFLMGTPADEPERFAFEGPQHKVKISSAFAVSKFEITFSEYDNYANATGTEKPSDKGWGAKYWGRIDTPVFNINWYDAVRYTEWLSSETGHTYRLLTEAEWEYVARAGTTTRFHTGDCIDTHQANFHGGYEVPRCQQSGLYRGRTIGVGQFPANAWGLHDIHGNIFEWTQDCWHDSYEEAPTDGDAWLEGDDGNCGYRILRGGSWSGRPLDLRSGYRGRNKPDFKSIFIGLRIVREL